MVSDLFVYTVFVLGLMIAEAPVSVIFWKMVRKYFLDFGKVWSIGINSNTGQGEVRLVKPNWEGFKTRDGWEVPTEANFSYKDTGPLTFGANIFIWDKATGLLVRSATGETEQSDPSVKTAKNVTKAINVMQTAGQPIPFLAIAIVLGLVIIVGFFVLGAMINGQGA